MYVLEQTLTPQNLRVLGEATTFGDEWLEQETRGKREHKRALLPTERQAVPTTEPDWDYSMAKRQDQNHFARCILKGLRGMHTKSLNYAKLADTEQGGKEIPGKFLDRLQEALLKFTEINSKNSKREIILKDRFSLSRLQISTVSY